MDNYLMLDGKKYELSPELANALLSCVEPEPEKISPFERHLNARYFYIDRYGNASGFYYDSHDGVDEKFYAVANYCTDKALMEQRAMHETLNRLLWRYSETHKEPKTSSLLYHLYIRGEDGEVSFYSCDGRTVPIDGTFCSRATAEAAIEEIVKPFLASHPDFVW